MTLGQRIRFDKRLEIGIIPSKERREGREYKAPGLHGLLRFVTRRANSTSLLNLTGVVVLTTRPVFFFDQTAL